VARTRCEPVTRQPAPGVGLEAPSDVLGSGGPWSCFRILHTLEDSQIRNSVPQNPGDPEKGERSSLSGFWLGPP